MINLTPEEIFTAGGGTKALQEVKALFADFVSDVTSKKGRDEIASTAFKVAKEKNRIDALGKDFVAEIKQKAKVIDIERKAIWDGLEDFQKQIRQPLTEFEMRDKERVSMIESQLADLVALSRFDASPSSEEISARLRSLEMSNFTAWEEFTEKAKLAKEEAVKSLNEMLKAAIQREAEQAELARLRAAEEARAQKERDEAIAREAAAKAKAEAERVAAQEAAKAELARQAVIAEKAEAETRLARAQAEAKAAAEKAEADRIAAEAKAKRDAEAAVEAERQRQASEKAEAERLSVLRENDKKHKASINNAAVAALVEAGLTADAAKSAVIAIASGSVPNVKISY